MLRVLGDINFSNAGNQIASSNDGEFELSYTILIALIRSYFIGRYL